MGEARNGACVGDLHHAWFLPNRPDLTVFGMNRALGVTAVSSLCRTGGVDPDPTAYVHSSHPPDSGWVTSRHRREAKEDAMSRAEDG
jgi:hypothetical protein